MTLNKNNGHGIALSWSRKALYRCNYRALTSKHQQKLTTWQRRMERSILGFSLWDKNRPTDIRKTIQLAEVTKENKTLKWKWAGLNVMEWIPREKEDVPLRDGPTTLKKLYRVHK